MIDYDGIRRLSRIINGGTRSITLVYLKDEDRIATWQGNPADDIRHVPLGELVTHTISEDGWEFDMPYFYILFKGHQGFKNAWYDFIRDMSDKLPEFTYWEKL
jgi:hypothetical protein